MEDNEIILSGAELDVKMKTLKQVKIDSDRWETYFIDESSGQKWVQQFPHSEMHGGGPPILKAIDKFPWE